MNEDTSNGQHGPASIEARPPRRKGRENEAVNSDPATEGIELAQRLYAEWQAGKAKSLIERETWNDGRSHGRRFDRLISRTLGLPTVKRSKLSGRVGDLEGQVRSLGQVPVGTPEQSWERQLIHARQSCLSALRVWNDPTASFRAEALSLLLRAELDTDHGTVKRVAGQLGYGVESVRAWARQADIDAGAAPGVTTADRQRIKEQEVP